MKTVLFDLDGTLLPMDQEEFIKAYFGGLATKLVPYGYEPNQLINAIWTGTKAMVANDGTMTNEERFWQAFQGLYEEDVRKDEPLFEDFYRNEFRFVSFVCGHTDQAARIIAWLKERGCRCVLATNPIFPAIATGSRMQWAGLKAADFDLVTTYENSRYCKPNPDYYREILQKIGEVPENCIMVGNDVTEDMVARELGMQVFLLTDCMINKENKDISQYPHGSFDALMDYLEQNI
jgi:FMN phosphatase YigB (HAD superfamily)